MPPTFQAADAICCFSPAGDLLAISTPDGRIKTFDTGNGQLIADAAAIASKSGDPSSSRNGHLSERHTCISWAERTKNSVRQQIVVAGTSAGDVKALDVASAELLWVCRGCCEGGVSGIATVGHDEVYATGADSKVYVLDLSSGKMKRSPDLGKGPFTALAGSQDGQLLAAASSTISVWNNTSNTRLCKYTGHPVGAKLVKFSSSQQYMASLGDGERHVALWKLPSSGQKPSKKPLPAAATLSMTSAVVQLDIAPSEGEDGAVYVLGVASNGEACVWHCTDAGNGTAQHSVVGRLRGAGGQSGDVLSACILDDTAEAVNVLLARGSPAKPAFERVQVLRGGGAGAVVELAPIPGGVLLPADGAVKGKAKQAQAAATVLGTDNAGEAILRAGVADPEKRKKKKKKGQEDGVEDGALDAPKEAAQAAGSKRRQPEPAQALENGVPHGMEVEGEEGGAEASGGEETLAAQVQRIEEQMERQQRQAESRTAEAGPSGALPLKADSLAVLLTQAVKSGDKALLERVVEVSDPRVLRNTVRRLSATDAASFLAAAVARMQSRPARGAQLAGWVRAVLLQHAAFLMAAPGAQPTLTALYQTIEARLAMHKPLLALAGRLELVLAQAPSHAGTAGGDDDEAAGPGAGPQTIYQESGSDEEPEAEDAMAPELSDDNGDSYEDEEGGLGGEGDEGSEEDDFMDDDDEDDL